MQNIGVRHVQKKYVTVVKEKNTKVMARLQYLRETFRSTKSVFLQAF